MALPIAMKRLYRTSRLVLTLVFVVLGLDQFLPLLDLAPRQALAAIVKRERSN